MRTISRRADSEAAMRERFERARAEGDLPVDSDPADLALYVATVIQGMCIQAAGGATRDELRRVIKTAMRACRNNPSAISILESLRNCHFATVSVMELFRR